MKPYFLSAVTGIALVTMPSIADAARHGGAPYVNGIVEKFVAHADPAILENADVAKKLDAFQAITQENPWLTNEVDLAGKSPEEIDAFYAEYTPLFEKLTNIATEIKATYGELISEPDVAMAFLDNVDAPADLNDRSVDAGKFAYGYLDDLSEVASNDVVISHNLQIIEEACKKLGGQSNCFERFASAEQNIADHIPTHTVFHAMRGIGIRMRDLPETTKNDRIIAATFLDVCGPDQQEASINMNFDFSKS